MSRTTVRQVITAFLSEPAIEGLGAVYPARPRNIPPKDYYQPGFDSGAIAYPYLESQSERRIAIGGEHGGQKWRTYQVGLVLHFRTKTNRNSTDASADHDAIVEAITERLQADRKLGTTAGAANEIFQAGEGDGAGATDIEVISDLPQHEGDHSTIWSVIRFSVIEILDT